MRQVLKTTRNQRGAALVEMALVLPILAILFLGIIQFGLVLREHQIVQNAAREGARISMLGQYQCKAWDSTGTSPLTAIGAVTTQYLNTENISVTAGSFDNTCPATSGTATLSGGGISSGSITVDQNVMITLPDGSKMPSSQVTVSYTKNPIVGGSFFGSFTYTGTAVFRNLYGN
jgi:Flp pilus assembly protein TadG